MPDLGRVLDAAALAEKEYTLWLGRREQIHNGGGAGRAHTEVDDAEPAVGVRRRLHRPVETAHRHVEASRKFLDVVTEVGEQDVLTELRQRRVRIARQPVLNDCVLGLHSPPFWRRIRYLPASLVEDYG